MSTAPNLYDYQAHFYRISRIFTLTLDVDEMLRRVMDEVVAATGAERGFLLLRDAHGGLLVRAARGQGGSNIATGDVLFSTAVVQRVIAAAQPLLTLDAPDDPELRERASTLSLSPRSILCVPLQFRDTLLGVLYVDNRLYHGAFTSEHLELLTALALHTAIAIENARVLHGMHAQLAALQLLHAISADLSSTLDLQRVLTACLERVQAVLGTAAASILTLDQGELVFQVAIGDKASELKPFRVPLTQGIAGWVARNAQGTFSNDAYGDERFYGNVDRRSGFVTQMVMAAPLIVQNRVIGVIEVFNKPGGFDDSDLDLLSTIAASAAIAIENARLYQVAVEKGRLEQEVCVARDVQANLIPRTTPSVPGWDFAGHWQPALEVSGDFYDYVSDAQGRPGLVIADVADKGMAAALFMALARSIVRTSVGQGRTPAESIMHANRLICADASDGMFVTLCYVQIYPDSGELAYVNAGHPAPLLYHAATGAKPSPVGAEPQTEVDAGGELIELSHHAAPLGIDDAMLFADRSAQMEPGDFVFLYTDGITDALNAAGEEFGKARLLSVVTGSRHASARDICEAVRATLTEFIGVAAPADDATFAVVRRAGGKLITQTHKD